MHKLAAWACRRELAVGPEAVLKVSCAGTATVASGCYSSLQNELV